MELASLKDYLTVGALGGETGTLCQMVVGYVLIVALEFAMGTGVASFGAVLFLVVRETGALHGCTTQTAFDGQKLTNLIEVVTQLPQLPRPLATFLSLPTTPVDAVDSKPGENASEILVREDPGSLGVAHGARVAAVSESSPEAGRAEDSAAALHLGRLTQHQQTYRTLCLDFCWRCFHELAVVTGCFFTHDKSVQCARGNDYKRMRKTRCQIMRMTS